MSSDNNGDPDVSRIFSQKVDKRFQRDFGRYLNHHQLHQQTRNIQNQDKVQQHKRAILDHNQKVDNKSGNHHLNLQLIEAKENIDSLCRQLNTRNDEIERLKEAENVAKEKNAELQRQIVELKMEEQRNRRRSRDFTENKDSKNLLLNDFRTAISKYNTWMKYADKQMQTMKELLEEHGIWNEANRYRIHFSYRGMQPELLTDDKVQQLATGSIMDYSFNIENIEGITASEPHPKFHTTFVQTDECMPMLNMKEQEESNLEQLQQTQNPSFLLDRSQPAFDQSFDETRQPEQMSAYDVRLLESEQQIERLERQNAQMRDQLIILSERSKYVELLEEQKKDLQMQMEILRRHNDQLLTDHEKLKSAFSGARNNRNLMEELVVNSGHLKEKNQELEQKLQQMEAQKDKVTMAECKRIAQIFKQKYGTEIAELRTRLNKYEPLHASDTTRILRFAPNNPLDEAHDEHLVRNIATIATTEGSSKTNPLKRRKLEDDVADTTGIDLTFLAADAEEEADPALIRELRLQLDNLKSQLKQTESEQADYLAQYRELVTMLSGYNIRFGEDGFCEAENVHSKNCTFLFQKHQYAQQQQDEENKQQQQPIRPTVDLLDNDCAHRWKDVLENYLVRYHSVPAFLSAVTISLVESPETPVSSLNSPATSSVVDLPEQDGAENDATM